MLKNKGFLLLVGLVLTMTLANFNLGQAAPAAVPPQPAPASAPPQPPPPPGGRSQDQGGSIATLSGHFVDIPPLGKTDFLLVAENPEAFSSPDVVRTHMVEVKREGQVWEIPLTTGEFYGYASGPARVVALDWFNPAIYPQWGIAVGRQYRFLGYLIWEAGVGGSISDARVPLGATGYIVALDGTGGRAYFMPADLAIPFDETWKNPNLGAELFGQGSKESGWWFESQRIQRAPEHLYGAWCISYWTWGHHGAAPSTELIKMAAFYSRMMLGNDYPKWSQFWRDYTASGLHTWRTRASE